MDLQVIDLEKGIEEAIGSAPDDAQIPPPMAAGGEEKELLTPDLRDLAVTDGDVIAANMKVNPGKKSLIRCWLVVTAFVMILTNHIQSAPKYQPTPLELMVVFTMFVCAIFLVFRTMKQM